MSQMFVVTFFDEDRETILEKKEVAEGQKVEYTGKMPEKAMENGVEYRFSGWETTGNLESVTENIDVFAQYEESDLFFNLSETATENAKLNSVLAAGEKIGKLVEATKNMTPEEKESLINEVLEKGSVNLSVAEREDMIRE